MFLFFKLALRNLMRNKRRTFLSGLAIGIGLAALIFSDAYMIGTKEHMIEAATETFLGEAQIHREGFMDNFEAEKVIEHKNAIVDSLKKSPYIKYYTERAQTFGMISSPVNANSIALVGIDVNKEKKISKLSLLMSEGEFLKENDDNKVIIGKKLSEILEVEVGDKVVITVAQAYTGELSQELFRIGGIFNFGVREMDSGMAFITLAKSQKMLNIGNDVHEIVLKFQKLDMASDKNLSIWQKISQKGNEVKNWREMIPELSSALNMFNFSLWLLAIILFSIVAIGIINTLFMSLYERMFEFGILKAVGTRPFYMGLMIVFEAAWLSLISSVIGIVIGYGVSYYFVVKGIDYSGTEFVGVTLTGSIYPIIELNQYIIFPALLICFTSLVSIYPAVFASLITPAKAMKK